MDYYTLLYGTRKMSVEEASQAFKEHYSRESVRRSTGKPMMHYTVGMALISRLQELGQEAFLMSMGYRRPEFNYRPSGELKVQPLSPPRGLIFSPTVQKP